MLASPFGDAHGVARERRVRRGGAEEGRVDAQERGGAEDRADVVRVAHAIERDAGAAALREALGEVVHVRPAARARRDDEPLVVRAHRDARELVVARLARVAATEAAHRVRHLALRAAPVRDAHDVHRARLEHREPGAQPVHHVAVLPLARRRVARRVRARRRPARPRSSLHDPRYTVEAVGKSDAITFQATIGREWVMYIVDVPPRRVARVEGRGATPVVYTANGSSERRTTIAPRKGGGFKMHLHGAVRRETGVTVGDKVKIAIRRDTGPKGVEIGTDLEDALREANALAAFRAMGPSHQRELVAWMEQAKREETRIKRIARLVERACEKREKMIDKG